MKMNDGRCWLMHSIHSNDSAIFTERLSNNARSERRYRMDPVFALFSIFYIERCSWYLHFSASLWRNCGKCTQLQRCKKTYFETNFCFTFFHLEFLLLLFAGNFVIFFIAKTIATNCGTVNWIQATLDYKIATRRLKNARNLIRIAMWHSHLCEWVDAYHILISSRTVRFDCSTGMIDYVTIFIIFQQTRARFQSPTLIGAKLVKKEHI